jgi:hypothetical protein
MDFSVTDFVEGFADVINNIFWSTDNDVDLSSGRTQSQAESLFSQNFLFNSPLSVNSGDFMGQIMKYLSLFFLKTRTKSTSRPGRFTSGVLTE